MTSPHLPSSSVLPVERVRSRDRLRERVSVMNQVTTLVALGSTGIIAGALAHQAHLNDALSRPQAVVDPTATTQAPAPTTGKPVRTVVVRAHRPAAKQPATARTVTPARTSSTRKSASAKPRPAATTTTVTHAAPKRTTPSRPAPQPASSPAATTSSGS